MFKIKCFICPEELDEKGAIIISPPRVEIKDKTIDYVEKYHICSKCFGELMEMISNMGKRKRRRVSKRGS